MHIEGTCHCGNLSFSLDTAHSQTTIRARACDCAFCSRHGARCYSDPEGTVAIVARDAALLQRYRFGHATADFLICRRCGVYLGAIVTQGEIRRATVNLRLTALRDLPATTVSYQDETREMRIARRLARWTPAQLRITE